MPSLLQKNAITHQQEEHTSNKGGKHAPPLPVARTNRTTRHTINTITIYIERSSGAVNGGNKKKKNTYTAPPPAKAVVQRERLSSRKSPACPTFVEHCGGCRAFGGNNGDGDRPAEGRKNSFHTCGKGSSFLPSAPAARLLDHHRRVGERGRCSGPNANCVPCCCCRRLPSSRPPKRSHATHTGDRWMWAKRGDAALSKCALAVARGARPKPDALLPGEDGTQPGMPPVAPPRRMVRLSRGRNERFRTRPPELRHRFQRASCSSTAVVVAAAAYRAMCG